MARFHQDKGPPSKTLNRKEKRKAERKLKKARRDAFNHKNFDLIQKNLKDVDSAYKFNKEKADAKRAKKKEKQKKKDKKVAEEEAESTRLQGIRLAIKKDDRELKQLEKNLKFRKKKGKTTLPTSFTSDGLDYILDATDSEKIKDLEDVATSAPIFEDSSTDSDDYEDDEIKADLKQSSWDSEARAKKSILKTDEDGVAMKKVKFADDQKDSDEDEDMDENESSFSEEEPVEESEGDYEEDEDVDMNSLPYSDDEEALDSKEVEHHNLKTSEREADEDTSGLTEDIYGRLRDKEGNIVKTSSVGSYIPPAKRAMMEGSQGNEVLRKKLKGFVNRISEGTIQMLSSQVEALYLDYSRAEVNETLSSLIMEAVIVPTLSPERLVQELAMLVAILHSNVGSEIGAFFLQKLTVQFDELMTKPDYGIGKTIDNVLTFLTGLYNFKIVHANLIIEITKKLMDSFKEKDIELLLLVLKLVGFTLRKDNPVLLKQMIIDIQTKVREVESSGVETMQSRIRFILDVLTALRNNNMSKIPGYNPTHLEHLRKLIKSMIRGQSLGDNQLNIGLEDLLKADKQGRWWIVGSAWDGRSSASETDIKEAKSKTESFSMTGISKQMVKLAKQQGMNTDIRRHVFCILGTSEDFEDACTRLLRLGLNRTQEREIIYVLFHCCLNEKEFNPFYGFLANRFCSFDRRYAITVQFTMWDKFKEIDGMDKKPRSNLAHLLAHLLLSKALSISVFKVIDFGMESKKMIRFLVQVLTEILTSPNVTTILEIFERIAPFPKLKALRQGLQVFMRINLKANVVKAASGSLLMERIERAELSMFSHHTSNAVL